MVLIRSGLSTWTIKKRYWNQGGWSIFAAWKWRYWACWLGALLLTRKSQAGFPSLVSNLKHLDTAWATPQKQWRSFGDKLTFGAAHSKQHWPWKRSEQEECRYGSARKREEGDVIPPSPGVARESQLIRRSKLGQQGWHPVQWRNVCGLCFCKTVTHVAQNLTLETDPWRVRRHVLAFGDKCETRDYTSAQETLRGVWS